MIGALRYVTGDAVHGVVNSPEVPTRILAHVCNDRGGWGKGFVLAVSKAWPEPEREYRRWHGEGARDGFALGATQIVPVEDALGRSLFVANMVAQRGYRADADRGALPLVYAALGTCLWQLGSRAQDMKAVVHMPRIGTGLAGGDWGVIETLIREHLCARGVPVVVYALPAKASARKGRR